MLRGLRFVGNDIVFVVLQSDDLLRPLTGLSVGKFVNRGIREPSSEKPFEFYYLELVCFGAFRDPVLVFVSLSFHATTGPETLRVSSARINPMDAITSYYVQQQCF